MKKQFDKLSMAFWAATAMVAGWEARAGDLAPPAGPITSTMKNLDTVEPRIPLPDPAAAARGPGIVIAAPGSYFLVADVVGVAGTAGITIDAEDVTLDLNGFSVIGIAGSLDGIVVLPAGGGLDRNNISIFNGVVRDWAGDGVDAIDAANSQIYDLRVYNNGTDGIRLGVNGKVTRCVSNTHPGDGIETGGAGIVSQCTLFGDNVGVRTGLGGVVTDCTVVGSRLGGIIVGESSTVRNCNLALVFDTTGVGTGGGINVAFGCHVFGNMVTSGPILGGADGIRATGGGNHIQNNTVRIVAGAAAGVSGIEVTAGGNLIVGNSVSSGAPAVSYSIAAGNTAGPIVDAATIAGSMNPHANYDY